MDAIRDCSVVINVVLSLDPLGGKLMGMLFSCMVDVNDVVANVVEVVIATTCCCCSCGVLLLLYLEELPPPLVVGC